MFLSYEPNESAVFDNTVIREGYLPVSAPAAKRIQELTPATKKHEIYLLEQAQREEEASSSEGCTSFNAKSSFTSRPASLHAMPSASGANASAGAVSSAANGNSNSEGVDNAVAKPYACTYPGCNRTYKNLNGLKYHATHGHLASSNDADKPYECPVYACARRYKNPNGLKYHMDHAHKNVEFG
jgi:hypothetical protein